MDRLKVMTWNVENLYPPGGEFGPGTFEQYRDKLASLARVIAALDPDVVALQEVGNPVAFQDLLDLLEERWPVGALSLHPDARGIRVGFLSKLAILEREEITDFPESGLPLVPGLDSRGNLINVKRLGRGALRIKVQPRPGFPVHCLCAHLKSKLLTYPSLRGGARFSPKDEDERALAAGIALLKRTAEAAALRVAVNALLASGSGAVVLMGSLNDVVSAATTQVLQGPASGSARLVNLAAGIPAARRYSRIHQGNAELLDNILVSPELLPVGGGPAEVDSHVEAMGNMPSITDNPGERQGLPGSDHAPVTAMLAW